MGLSIGWDFERAGRIDTAGGGLVIQRLRADACSVILDKRLNL